MLTNVDKGGARGSKTCCVNHTCITDAPCLRTRSPVFVRVSLAARTKAGGRFNMVNYFNVFFMERFSKCKIIR